MSVVKILACLGLEQNQTFFKGLIIKISAHPKMADFGSVQGRSYFVTAGVASYVEDCKIARTLAWTEKCHFWMETGRE